MIGYRAIQEQAEPWILVLLTPVFAVPALIAAIPAGRATDRWGGAHMAVLGSLVGAAGIVLVLVLPGLGWLLAGSAVIGLGNLMSMVGQQAFVAHVSRGGPTEGAFGFLSATASAGQAVGPLIVTLVADMTSDRAGLPNTTPGLFLCLCMCLLSVAVYWPMRTAENHSPQTAHRSPTGHDRSANRVPLGKVWPAIVVSGLVLVTMDLLYTFIPVWGVQHGVGAVAVGVLLSLRATVSMVSRIGLGLLVRRIGRRRLMVLSTLLACVALALFPHSGLMGAVFLMLLLGIGIGVPQPLTMSWSVSLTAPSLHGAVLGLRLSANRLAQIAVPLLVAGLAAPLGSSSVFYTNAVLMATASSLAYARKDADSGPEAAEGAP